MRADRLLSMMLLLQSRGRMTAQDLAEQLEVSERTIYRDLDALSIAGVPVYTQSGVNGGVFLDENYRVSLTGLSKQEIHSLFITSSGGPLKDLGLARTVEDSLLKLLSALPSVQRDEAERMRCRFYIDPMDWFQAEEPTPFLAELQSAVWDNRELDIVYQRYDGSRTERRIRPYGLVAKATIWYLVAKQLDGDNRTFRVSRLHDVVPSETIFARDESFDLAAYWKAACRQFEKRIDDEFTPFYARLRVHVGMFWYFEDYLAGQFEILDRSDADWVTMNCSFESVYEAARRVLSLGTSVEVLDPPELIAHLTGMAQSVLDRYATLS